MKRLVFAFCLVSAVRVAPAKAACDPALMYQTVKAAVFEKEPSTTQEFDGLMASLGPTLDGHVWKCENAEGTFLAVFIPAKRSITLDYTPNKAEKVPDAILSILAAQAHAEPVGPRWIRFEYKSDEKVIAAFGSPDEIEETITVSLAGAVYEGTQCTIRLGAKAKR